MINFLTIVLNGQPYITRHLAEMEASGVPFHWWIVEGLADLKGCTGWSLARGGRVPMELTRNYLSVDGTREYLENLIRSKHPHVTVFGKPDLWNGKLEMVNEPLKWMYHGLLWEIDSDEIWSAQQIRTMYEMFEKDKARWAAWFFCEFFVGDGLRLINRGKYGNNPAYEWKRVWRFQPGMMFSAHEPPTLICPGMPGDVSNYGPFRHAETEAAGLVFKHYAYCTEASVRFKEAYYGYKGAVDGWKRLQAHNQFPCDVSQFLAWIPQGTLVERVGRR